MGFEIRRGTNLSHWLSQSDRRGPARAAFFGEGDVRRLAAWGFDHLRLPVDEEQLWDAQGRLEAEAFGLLDAALDGCAAAGLRAVVDLHIVRSHYFNQKSEPALFTDPAALARFVAMWEELSGRLRGRSPDAVAYELLNEAVARDPEDWNRVARAAFEALRRREPSRTIVLGSNRWNAAATFDRLWVPDDRRTVLTFHFYLPMLVTHYTANWWSGGRYTGRIRYPGRPALDPVDGDLVAQNEPYDRATMVRDIARPLEVRERTGLPLYCGEFGVYQAAPAAVRAAWYRDFVSVLDEHRIAWANWDYKGGFGLVDGRGVETGVRGWLLGDRASAGPSP